MEAEITKDITENNVPYVELKFSPLDPRDGVFYITFRKYYKNIFVGVEDYRGDYSSGVDLEDCWIAPTYIIEKTPIHSFEPHRAFISALKRLGEIEQQGDTRLEYWNDIYEKCCSCKVKEWEAA